MDKTPRPTPKPMTNTRSLEQRHADARRNPPPYAVRKQLREATLKVGRES